MSLAAHSEKLLFVFFSVSCHQRCYKHRDRSVPKEAFACTDPSFLGHTPQAPPQGAAHSFITRGLLNQQQPRRASIDWTTHKHLFSKKRQAEVFLKNEVRYHCSQQKSHLETLPQAWGGGQYHNRRGLALRTWATMGLAGGSIVYTERNTHTNTLFNSVTLSS